MTDKERHIGLGQTINITVPCSQIDQVHDKLTSRLTSLVNKKRVLHLHDKVKSNVTLGTSKKLQNIKRKVLPYPPCTSIFFHVITFINLFCYCPIVTISFNYNNPELFFMS